jgi:hypothetical protein
MRKILVLVVSLLMFTVSYAQVKPQGETLNFPAFKFPNNSAYQSKIRRAQEPEKKVSVNRLPQQRDFAPRKQIRKTYRPQQVYYYQNYSQPVYDPCSYSYCQQQYPWVSTPQRQLPICVSAVQRVCVFPFDVLSLLFGGGDW